ncbi:MAG: Gfo/Idh/MocA family oxidoreductase [Polyangiaceae bacterium]|nr:Gfo/Idh/MocA family oxidoreductase [Myxococcales bacterium]MCB9587243.1 Gfo/Idh/MocA family oxidoreductase [Polyangiaceae bacterium]MCB9609374.1 Gfo/Idh/MocA family oxidoreductase [Polyangiaceae bacterium]
MHKTKRPLAPADLTALGHSSRAVRGTPFRASIPHCLFVGLGGVGQRHLRNLFELFGRDGVRVSAVRMRREQTVLDDKLQVVPGARLEDVYPMQVFDTLEPALGHYPDVVFVTNPNRLHIPVARAAVEHGAHVFIEKPISDDEAGIAGLVELARETGVVGMVAYQLRQHPGFRKLQAWLGGDRIGRVLSVRADIGEYLPGFHPYEDYRRMYASRADQGGGVICTQIHEIDLLGALFGRPERVFAIGGQLSSLEVDVEDVALSLLEYRHADGGLLPVHLHQDYTSRPARRAISIYGEAGSIEFDLKNAKLSWYCESQLKEQHDYSEYPRNQLFLSELAHFFECIQLGKQPVVNLEAGTRSLEVGLALKRSLASRMPEFVPDLLANIDADSDWLPSRPPLPHNKKNRTTEAA